jgi:hypothetical protein
MTVTVFKVAAVTSGFSRLGDSGMYDANDIGLICTTGIPLFVLTLRTSRLAGKIASLSFIACAAVAIARTGSRGAFLGIMAVAVTLLFTARSA